MFLLKTLAGDPLDIYFMKPLYEYSAQNHAISKDEMDSFVADFSALQQKHQRFFKNFYEGLRFYRKNKKIMGICIEYMKASLLTAQFKDIVWFYGSARTQPVLVPKEKILEIPGMGDVWEEFFEETKSGTLAPKKDFEKLLQGSKLPRSSCEAAREVVKNSPSDGYFRELQELVQYLVLKFREEHGREITVGTGGGPGQMAAANLMAVLINAASVGIKIQLPFEAAYNLGVRFGILVDRFFTRIAGFYDSAKAHVISAGGFGTLQEMFSKLALLSLKKMDPRQVVVFNQNIYKAASNKIASTRTGLRFYDRLHDFIQNTMYLKYGFVTRDDAKLYALANSHAEVYGHLNREDQILSFKRKEEQQPKENPKAKSNLGFSFIKLISTFMKGDLEHQGMGNDFVRLFKVANGKIMSILNAVYEHVSAEVKLSGRPKSITFITPRGKVPEFLEEMIDELAEGIPRLGVPVAFDHRSDIPHRLLSNPRMQKFKHEVRVFDTLLSYAQREKKLPGIIQRYKFKRHDIKKTSLIDSSRALVIFPGGFETVDFLFEVICLIQTYKLKGVKIPKIILVDPCGDFYKKLRVKFLEPIIVRVAGMAEKKDLKFLKIVATAEEGLKAAKAL